MPDTYYQFNELLRLEILYKNIPASLTWLKNQKSGVSGPKKALYQPIYPVSRHTGGNWLLWPLLSFVAIPLQNFHHLQSANFLLNLICLVCCSKQIKGHEFRLVGPSIWNNWIRNQLKMWYFNKSGWIKFACYWKVYWYYFLVYIFHACQFLTFGECFLVLFYGQFLAHAMQI